MSDKLYRACPMCGEEFYAELTAEEMAAIRRYQRGGVLIQNALPDFNPMEREFIKTGYCPECQSMLFGTNFSSKRICKTE